MTDWNNLFKIRLSNIVDDSTDLHDIIKLILMRKILRKHKRRNWIRLYSEFKLNGMIADVYFENIKTKTAIAYEIQKKYTKEWLDKKTKQYNNYNSSFNLDFIPINLNECPDKISEINSWLDKYVF